MAAASNVIPFSLLYMRPLQWWLRTKGFSPRGNPFCMIKVTPGPSSTTSHCPVVAGQSMVPRFNIPSRRTCSGAPRQEGPSVPSRGLDISPITRTVETVGLASNGAPQQRLLRPFSTPELPPRGNFMLWIGKFSLQGVVTVSWTQLTAQWVQCWSSCKIGSLQG